MSALMLALFLACGDAPTVDAPAADAPAADAPSADAPSALPRAGSTPPDAAAPAAEALPWPPAQERSPDPAVVAALAQLDAGDAAGALAALDARIAAAPTDADALLGRGIARLASSGDAPPSAEQLTAAEADFTAALTHDPAFVQARIRMADLLIPQRRCGDALPHLDYMVEHHGQHADAWANRAFCRLATRDFQAGVADAERACELGHSRSCAQLPMLHARQAQLAADGQTPADAPPDAPPAAE